MSHLRHLFIVVVVPALILVVFAVSSVVASGPAGKTTVCHNAGGHKFVEITVNDHALPAHMNHGDVLTDEYGDCPKTRSTATARRRADGACGRHRRLRSVQREAAGEVCSDRR